MSISLLPVFEKVKPNIIIHALKCVTVSPVISNPNNYFKSDKKHFTDLWQKAQRNNAKLVLVNYSPTHERVKRIWVKHINNVGVVSEKQDIISQKQCKQWLTDLKKTYTII